MEARDERRHAVMIAERVLRSIGNGDERLDVLDQEVRMLAEQLLKALNRERQLQFEFASAVDPKRYRERQAREVLELASMVRRL